MRNYFVVMQCENKTFLTEYEYQTLFSQKFFFHKYHPRIKYTNVIGSYISNNYHKT